MDPPRKNVCDGRVGRSRVVRVPSGTFFTVCLLQSFDSYWEGRGVLWRKLLGEEVETGTGRGSEEEGQRGE